MGEISVEEIIKKPIKKMLARKLGISKNRLQQLLDGQAVVSKSTESADIHALLKSLKPVENRETPLIRLGPDSDGGYLIPDDLDGITACFSPGVDQISGFEKDCADRGMEVFLADYSVDNAALEDEKFHFSKKFIGALTNEQFMTMDHWASNSLKDDNSDLLLQMDIEGGEYEALINISDQLLQRFRIIALEVHQLDQLWQPTFFSMVSTAINKLLQTHQCVHTHPNNCCGTVKRDGIELPQVCELTFIRKDRLKTTTPATTFPHPLDQDNCDKPQIPLPECWYR